MDGVFPFGFPFPTALYLALYVGTLAVHFLFMNYVLAGSLVVAWNCMGAKHPGDNDRGLTMVNILRDWLPFALGAAITAGVAPLLFVQILYKPNFYTANLLLSHRWMAVVPVLIVGFYLLYVLKSESVRSARRWIRIFLGCGAALCFLFTAYSWVENHLLSLAGDAWPAFYAAARWNYAHDALLPRFGVWLFSAFPTMSVLVAWQLALASRSTVDAPAVKWNLTRAAVMALSGLILCAFCLVWFYNRLAPHAQASVWLPAARPYLWLAASGIVIQVVAWSGLQLSWRGTNDDGGSGGARRVNVWLGLASMGCLCWLTGACALRECLRIASVDLEAMFPVHERIAASGGMAVFVGFLILNIALIGGVLFLVGRSLRKD